MKAMNGKHENIFGQNLADKIWITVEQKNWTKRNSWKIFSLSEDDDRGWQCESTIVKKLPHWCCIVLNATTAKYHGKIWM